MLLRERAAEPEIIEYLRVGWDAATLKRLAAGSGVGLRGLLRSKEEGVKTLLAADADDATILKAMIADPILVERPIVETTKGSRIGRPIERVLEVL